MKRRICLQGNSLQLADITSQREKGNAVWLAIVLNGAFRIEGVQAEYDESGRFSQNWSGSPLRFIDCPILHRRENRKDEPLLLLQDIIAREACLYFWRNNSRMRNLLSRKPKGVDLEKFEPEDWGKRKLTIPVEFIGIKSLKAWHKNGDVFASVRIGHHLIAFSEKIYRSGQQKFCFDSNIVENKRLKEAVVKMIEGDQKLQERILRVSKSGFSDFSETSFIDKIEECDPEGLPPPVSLC